MKINVAFLIIAHTDMDQLKRLCKKLTNYGDLYIHIDEKTDVCYVSTIKKYISTLNTDNEINILSARISVFWGGYNSIYAIRNLLESAIKNSQKTHDRVFLLSGLCYPLFSKEAFMQFCDDYKGKELMTAYNITTGLQKQQERVILYHLFRDIYPPLGNNFLRRCIIAGARTALKYFGLRKKIYLMTQGQKWDIYTSSAWFGLTGACAQYVYDMLSRNKDIERYFKTSYASDELVIPTIVMNSSFGQTAEIINYYNFEELSRLHYLHYTDAIWSYDENDFEEIMQSGKPFVRKLTSGKSEKLIEMIDENASGVLEGRNKQ